MSSPHDGRDEQYDPDSDVGRFLRAFSEALPVPPLSPTAAPPSVQEQAPTPVSAAVASSEASRTMEAPPDTYIGEMLAFDDEVIANIAEHLGSIDVDSLAGGMDVTGFMEEDEPVYTRFELGELDCTKCHTYREMGNSNEARNLYVIIHGRDGTFEHAIFDCTFTGSDGHPPGNELFYVNLRGRTHEWVREFLSQCLEILQSDTTGKFEDACSSFCTTVCTGTPLNDPNLEIDMNSLEALLAAQPDAAPPAAESAQFPHADVAGACSAAAGLMAVLSPQPQMHTYPILESWQVANQPAGSTFPRAPLFGPYTAPPPPAAAAAARAAGGASSSRAVAGTLPQWFIAPAPASVVTAAAVAPGGASSYRAVAGAPPARPSTFHRSNLAIQRERTANMSIREVAGYLHLPMNEAAQRLRMCSTALKHVCRKNGVLRWPNRQIAAIDRKIKKLDAEASSVKRKGGFLKIKEDREKLLLDKLRIYTKLLNAAWENNRRGNNS